MPIIIKNGVFDNHGGTVIKVRGDFDIKIDGITVRNYTVGNSRPISFDIADQKSLIEELGLSKETTPKELADLLTQLQGKSKGESKEIIKKTGFLEKLVAVKDSSILVTNLVILAGNPNLPQILEWLLSGVE